MSSSRWALVDCAYARIQVTLPMIEEKLLMEEAYNDEVFSLILNVWSLVDASYRTRELIQQLPSLPKKTPFVQTFLRQTQEVEEFRHGF